MDECRGCETVEEITPHFDAIFDWMENRGFVGDPDRDQIYLKLVEVQIEIHQEMLWGE